MRASARELLVPFLHLLYGAKTEADTHGLGGGGASKNKLKDTSFIFSMTNITILNIFRAHAQKEYCKVLETKGINILNNLVLLLLKTYNGFTKILI